jgi:transcriptional regulator with XRE-family HTH domain
MCQELVRALRGKRSQAALSRHLKFRTNVIGAWETGRNAPTASQLLALAARSGVDLRAALRGFYRVPPRWLDTAKNLTEPPSVLRFLNDLRGELPLAELARTSGLSRFALSRIFKGQAQVKGPEFLHLIQLCSRRVLDFLSQLTPVDRLPSFASCWEQQQARRSAASRAPWSLAVLCGLELEEYRALPRHVPGLLAERLRISAEAEAECLALLEECGQVRLRDGRYEPTGADSVELSEDRDLARARRAFWGQVAAERAQTGHGMSAYNVCGISKEDLQKLKALQREYLARARTLIASSQPVEAVALFNVHIVDLTYVQPSAVPPARGS